MLLFGLSAVIAEDDYYESLDSYVMHVEDKKFIPVSKITSELINKQFVSSVTLLRRHREKLAAIDIEIAESAIDQRAQLLEQRNHLAQTLENDNKFMVDRFGYSLHRNYTMTIEDSHLYRLTSEEELALLRESYPDQNWESSVRRGKDYMLILANVIEGEEANKAFQTLIQTVNSQREQKENYIEVANQVRAGTSEDYPDLESREAFMNWYNGIDDGILQNETYLNEHYGISILDGYMRVIVNSSLYVQVSDEELMRVPTEGLDILY